MTETQLRGYARQIKDAITKEVARGRDIVETVTVIDERASLMLAEVIERMIEQKFAELQSQ